MLSIWHGREAWLSFFSSIEAKLMVPILILVVSFINIHQVTRMCVFYGDVYDLFSILFISRILIHLFDLENCAIILFVWFQYSHNWVSFSLDTQILPTFTTKRTFDHIQNFHCIIIWPRGIETADFSVDGLVYCLVNHWFSHMKKLICRWNIIYLKHS